MARFVKHRREAVVIIPAEEFDRAGELVRQPESLLDFFQFRGPGARARFEAKARFNEKDRVVAAAKRQRISLPHCFRSVT